MDKFRKAETLFIKVFRPVRYAYQRLVRGYDDGVVWDLDEHLTKFIYPRLKLYYEYQSEHGMAYPASLDPAAWLEVLSKIVEAFRILHDGQESPENQGAVEEGLTLFGKYYRDLWE